MKKFFSVFLTGLLILGLMVVAVGCGSGSDQDGSESEKVMKVGTEATFAPFEFTETDGTITGFDVDLIKAIGEEMGYQVAVEHIEWDGLDPALNSEQVDVVISGVTITEERKLEMDFSEPYFEASQIIAVREDSEVSGMADLAGKKVGVQGNTTGQYVCEDAGLPDDNIIKYATIPDAMMNLSNGSLDAVVGDSPVVMNYIANNPEMKFKTVTDDFEKEYFGIKVKKGNQELLDDINAGLAKVQENGKFDEIFNKYFQK